MGTDKQTIMNHYTHPLEKETASKIFDKTDKVFKEQGMETTDFFDPHQLTIAEKVINTFSDVSALFYGGLADAERKKVGIFPKEWNVTPDQLGIEVLELRGNFRFSSISHRDVLGAVMGLGLKRDKIGDIHVMEEEHRLIIAVDESISQFITQNLTQVKNVSVSAEAMDQEEIPRQQEYTREIKGTVSSLRLDAVASIGFGASRSKMSQLIKAERIKLNWQPTKDPKATVSEGDVISLRGKGRVEISAIGGKSRKGRRHVTLKRYK
ncbi:RNA-binding protein [Natranaerobius thermophilus]|uniref:RNA-binding S4 domain protein n=1 Tax=Natranaerobius thermophilus (strain ATCC BAA-1301 / DSM 18059 / JW/NM-WN-LF) TaxID=457570 RepID=B2A2I6_NATTJ|nr:YlmH/Sll1252 family protein [Natranaerobius thermophilus]ACB84901.1 RNA-binding S4 domain protein [Natranaerobius thermophilus JW/NM-WN-LF]